MRARWVWTVLIATIASAGVSLVMIQVLRPLTIGGRGPQPAAGTSEASVNAARHAEGAVVSVETTRADGSTSSASGTIIDARGFVVTAEGAIAGAQRISVAVPSAKTADAQVVGTDTVTGLSVLKIDLGNLRALQLASGSPLEAGNGIVVVPAPPAPGLTVGAIGQAGVSASLDDPGRPGQKRALNDLVSLDINGHPGQLGAPVLDGSGRMVGVVVAVGEVSYGVDMNDAAGGLQQIMTSGHAAYPWLGFSYRRLSTTEAADRAIPGGVEVLEIAGGSAAARAGLAAGDVVTAVNGTVLDAGHSLRHALSTLPLNQDVTLTVRGAGAKERRVAVTLTLATP